MIVHRLQRWTESIFPDLLRLMLSCKRSISIQQFYFLGTLQTIGQREELEKFV